MSKKVAVIDYGLGNVASVMGAVEKIGHLPILTRDKDKLLTADCIILPGVGAFGDGMKNLQQYGLIDIIKECTLDKQIPLLGICLGMQLLASKSYEFGEHDGLDLISGEVTPFQHSNNDLRKIHIGWNDLTIVKSDPLFETLDNPVVYFVHSYHFVPKERNSIIATASYGSDVVAGIRKGNIAGLQFHPEKSQQDGLKILANFVEECRC